MRTGKTQISLRRSAQADHQSHPLLNAIYMNPGDPKKLILTQVNLCTYSGWCELLFYIYLLMPLFTRCNGCHFTRYNGCRYMYLATLTNFCCYMKLRQFTFFLPFFLLPSFFLIKCGLANSADCSVQISLVWVTLFMNFCPSCKDHPNTPTIRVKVFLHMSTYITWMFHVYMKYFERMFLFLLYFA